MITQAPYMYLRQITPQQLLSFFTLPLFLDPSPGDSRLQLLHYAPSLLPICLPLRIRNCLLAPFERILLFQEDFSKGLLLIHNAKMLLFLKTPWLVQDNFVCWILLPNGRKSPAALVRLSEQWNLGVVPTLLLGSIFTRERIAIYRLLLIPPPALLHRRQSPNLPLPTLARLVADTARHTTVLGCSLTRSRCEYVVKFTLKYFLILKQHSMLLLRNRLPLVATAEVLLFQFDTLLHLVC